MWVRIPPGLPKRFQKIYNPLIYKGFFVGEKVDKTKMSYYNIDIVKEEVHDMATDLKSTNTNTCLTRFWGGERGVCVQVSPIDWNAPVTLNRAEAAKLAEDLLVFANGNEVEDYV